ncbi:MAG TPA: hypothetical protein VMT54_05425 [Candidatus Cybelea sp.]|nr:hypothetical protein [Candidatus Cybelea sp.]
MADCGQYFKCVSKDAFHPLSNVIALGILTGALVIADIVVAVIAGAAIPGLGVVAGVAFIVAIFELCAFLHGGKLVCIQDNACTIGRIMELIPVGSDKSGFEKLDDDFTMNTLPSPHSPVETLAEMVASDPNQGPFLVAQSPSNDLGLPFSGVSVKFDDIPHDTEVFHVEVKGCRVHDVCGVLKALSFGAPVVGAICSIPLIGWVVCAIAALIWLAITATAVAIAWAAAHVGDINDVYDPASGTLTAADPKTGEGGDVILVRGDWVYDAGHAGWNEIQPIRSVQKLTDVVDPKYRDMAKADASLVASFKKEVLDVWCFHVGQSSDPVVIAAQQDPENRWHIHPSIDGCDKGPVIK